jgi:DNA-binding CsgD family transcriptional regulator
MSPNLRPVERRVLAMKDAGMSTEEIGRRMKRSSRHVSQIITLTDIPRRARLPISGLRPLERRVLAMRNQGLSHEEIGQRFRRSSGHIRRVEGLAHYRMALELLS